MTSEQPFDHQWECMNAHNREEESKRERERERERCEESLCTRTCEHTHTAGELQRTDNKEWINWTDRRANGSTTNFLLFLLPCMFYVHWYSDSTSMFKQERREVNGERVIDAESLRCGAEHIAKIQILSLRFFLLYVRRCRRPEDFVRRRRRRWEFSFLFSSLPPSNTKSYKHTGIHIYACTTQHSVRYRRTRKRSGMLWFFRQSNSQICRREMPSSLWTLHYSASACVHFVTWSGKKR